MRVLSSPPRFGLYSADWDMNLCCDERELNQDVGSTSYRICMHACMYSMYLCMYACMQVCM